MCVANCISYTNARNGCVISTYTQWFLVQLDFLELDIIRLHILVIRYYSHCICFVPNAIFVRFDWLCFSLIH